MKQKVGTILAVLALLCGVALADSYTVSLTVTNGQAITYSDPLPISGWLDRIEVVQSVVTTSTVTIATYSGTTAVDTYASLASLVGNKVVRPRFIGTSNQGTALAAAATGTSDYTAGTVLAAPYERPLLGGNLKMAVTEGGNIASYTVTATLYFVPTPR